MKVKVLEEITLSKTIIHPGEVIEITATLFPKLAGKVKPAISDSRNLSHYCQGQDCHCSTKLPGSTTQCHHCGGA